MPANIRDPDPNKDFIDQNTYVYRMAEDGRKLNDVPIRVIGPPTAEDYKTRYVAPVTDKEVDGMPKMSKKAGEVSMPLNGQEEPTVGYDADMPAESVALEDLKCKWIADLMINAHVTDNKFKLRVVAALAALEC